MASYDSNGSEDDPSVSTVSRAGASEENIWRS